MASALKRSQIIFTGSSRLVTSFKDGRVTDLILQNPKLCSIFTYGVTYSQSGCVKVYKNKFHDLGLFDLSLQKFGEVQQKGDRYFISDRLELALQLRRQGIGLRQSFRQAHIELLPHQLASLYLGYLVSHTLKLAYIALKKIGRAPAWLRS